MLNEKQKQRVRWWVEALRSGNYTQTSNALRDNQGYCCLGVACDVFRKKTKHGRWDDDVFVIGDMAEDGVLPDRVANWLGLDVNPIINPGGRLSEEQTASSCNDELCWNFNQIADAVERTYLNDGQA